MDFPRYPNNSEEKRMDMEANWFAASFLMPETQFRAVFRAYNGDIISVAARFRVLPWHANLRAKGLGLISSEYLQMEWTR